MSAKDTSLKAQLQETQNTSRKNIPEEIYAKMDNATKQLSESGILDAAPKESDTLPNFILPNQRQEKIALDTLLDKGNVVLTFYRGGWCPYCNLELRAYQEVLEDIHAAGASLVAVTPELPDQSLSTKEKNELTFEVLSDQGSEFARSIGIVFSLPEELRPIYQNFGIDVEAHNGNGQFDLPLAATFIIGKDRKILGAYVDTDYTKRKEPSEVVATLKSI